MTHPPSSNKGLVFLEILRAKYEHWSHSLYLHLPNISWIIMGKLWCLENSSKAANLKSSLTSSYFPEAWRPPTKSLQIQLYLNSLIPIKPDMISKTPHPYSMCQFSHKDTDNVPSLGLLPIFSGPAVKAYLETRVSWPTTLLFPLTGFLTMYRTSHTSICTSQPTKPTYSLLVTSSLWDLRFILGFLWKRRECHLVQFCVTFCHLHPQTALFMRQT